MARLVSALGTALRRRLTIDDYIVASTVISVFLFIPVKGNLMLGYFVVILNSLLLMALNKLAIHRNHLLAILAIGGFSLIGARSSGTSATAIASQIVGIGVMSVYYFSVFTAYNVKLERWIDLYFRAAFVLSVFALIYWPVATHLTGDSRLRAFYTEPSYYIFVTLPAVGYCINRFVNDRRYGWEMLVFLLCYALADSALGFLGLMLIALFAFAQRLRGWQIVVGAILFCAMTAGLYAASANVRVRINDMVKAVATQDLSGTGSSAFALLSNLYVTSQSFLAHPFTGIGIGGYANAYDKYIGDIHGLGLFFLSEQLNRDDGNSMLLRVAAELGIPGLLTLVAFIVICARVRGEPYLIIRNAILPYLLVRVARMGAYFTVELYFFVALYFLNYLSFRHDHGQAPKMNPPEVKDGAAI